MEFFLVHQNIRNDERYLALSPIGRLTFIQVSAAFDDNWMHAEYSLSALASAAHPRESALAEDGDADASVWMSEAREQIRLAIDLGLFIVEETPHGRVIAYVQSERYHGGRRDRGAPSAPMGPAIARTRDWSKIAGGSLKKLKRWSEIHGLNHVVFDENGRPKPLESADFGEFSPAIAQPKPSFSPALAQLGEEHCGTTDCGKPSFSAALAPKKPRLAYANAYANANASARVGPSKLLAVEKYLHDVALRPSDAMRLQPEQTESADGDAEVALLALAIQATEDATERDKPPDKLAGWAAFGTRDKPGTMPPSRYVTAARVMLGEIEAPAREPPQRVAELKLCPACGWEGETAERYCPKACCDNTAAMTLVPHG